MSTRKRDILVANIFNLIVGVYFIIIAVVSLIKLRWYHQITIAVRIRHVIALTSTSYFAFVILIAVGLLLIGIFIASSLTYTARVYINTNEKTTITITKNSPESNQSNLNKTTLTKDLNVPNKESSTCQKSSPTIRPKSSIQVDGAIHQYVTEDSPGLSPMISINSSMPHESQSRVYCWTFWHVIASFGLIVILTIWLINRGELVRQTISNQLEYSYSMYQFTNRTNDYSVLIDGMQDINNCCGQFDYSDFPHLGITGLSYGHYPGSCCGKNIFGSNARVICKPEEIIYFRQTVSFFFRLCHNDDSII